MTVGSAPTATAVRPPRPGPIRRIGLAAVVVLGPLSITILSANPVYDSIDDSTAIATKVAQHQTAQTVSLWLALIAAVTLVPGVIAIGLLAARRAPRLGTWGMAVAVTGFSFVSALMVIDFTAVAGARSGIGLGATTRLLDELNASPPLTLAIIAFVAGHVIGVILLGVALLKGRAIPPWAAWALIISAPLHIVFAVVVPSNILDAVGWALTTVGFAAAAVAITRTYRQA
jgi:hypothetical protein